MKTFSTAFKAFFVFLILCIFTGQQAFADVSSCAELIRRQTAVADRADRGVRISVYSTPLLIFAYAGAAALGVVVYYQHRQVNNAKGELEAFIRANPGACSGVGVRLR